METIPFAPSLLIFLYVTHLWRKGSKSLIFPLSEDIEFLDPGPMCIEFCGFYGFVLSETIISELVGCYIYSYPHPRGL